MEGVFQGDAADQEGKQRQSTGAIADFELNPNADWSKKTRRGLLGRYKSRSVRLLPT
jgi:hypothetical protein